jgi:hypothetical protein
MLFPNSRNDDNPIKQNTMAINITTDALYTRAGESDESNVISVHNPLILEFNDDTPIAAAATATVQFVVKNNAGGTIYTSSAFDAYLLSGGGGATAYFFFDATEILKHIIANYFYNEMSNDVISPENYGSEIDVTIKTYDGGVLENTDTSLIYFGCHALNQIGDEYGANIPRIFYNDTEDIAHFLGYPNKLFFYSPDDLSADGPYFEVFADEPTNPITTIVNGISNPYGTFTTVGTAITSAIAAAFSEAESGQTFTVYEGEQWAVLIPGLTINSGVAPSVYLAQGAGFSEASNKLTAIAGDNVIVLSVHTSKLVRLVIENSAAGNWSCDDIQVRKVKAATGAGTLGLYMHCIDLSVLALDKTCKYAKMYNDVADPTLIKTFNLDIFDPCENGVYVRYLNKNGVYSYWMFPGTKSTTRDGSKIGNVINRFSDMATANSRNKNIGYRDSFERITVISPAVPIKYRRKLIELFTSPAVYLWQGLLTPDENLISSLAGNYTTFESDETVILSAISASGTKSGWTDVFSVSQGEKITVVIYLTLNSGQVPAIRLINTAFSIALSSYTNLSNGYNQIELTATATAINDTRLQITNTAASDYSTGKILVKRAEVETDWILLESVEGSHNILEKKGADNFECTLVLPEHYTQKLSGQNL